MARLHRDVMRSVIERIARGDWSPGDMLPREQDLAARFRISRGVARESIQALEDRGVVHVKHGRGSTIAPPAEWNLLDPVVLDGLLAAPGGRELRDEVLEARLAVEAEVGALAAQRASKEDVAALQAALARMAELAERRRLLEEDAEDLDAAERAFHSALAAAAGNRLLGRTLAPLQGAMPLSAASAVARSRTVHGYAELLDAVASADEGAARATARELIQGAAGGRPAAAG
jgi:DNA-binding FadR family transcriptional regulator